MLQFCKKYDLNSEPLYTFLSTSGLPLCIDYILFRQTTIDVGSENIYSVGNFPQRELRRALEEHSHQQACYIML